MSKLIPIALMALSFLQAQNTTHKPASKDELIAIHKRFIQEKWGYLKAITQKESAYQLYTREKRLSKIIDSGLRQLGDSATNHKLVNLQDSIRDYFLRNRKLFDHDVAHSSSLNKGNGNNYVGLEKYVLERSKIENENNRIGSGINQYIQKEHGIKEKEDYFRYTELAQRAILHKNTFYLAVYRCWEKETEMLNLIRQELKPFDIDSLRTEITKSYEESRRAVDTIQVLGNDEELRALTTNLLDFYKDEALYLIDATEEYYRKKKAYNSYNAFFKKLDIKTMDQETYDGFKKRLIAITEAQTEWRDRRERFSRIRNQNHLEWNEKSHFFVENYLYERVPTYKKPKRLSIWAQN